MLILNLMFSIHPSGVQSALQGKYSTCLQFFEWVCMYISTLARRGRGVKNHYRWGKAVIAMLVVLIEYKCPEAE